MKVKLSDLARLGLKPDDYLPRKREKRTKAPLPGPSSFASFTALCVEQGLAKPFPEYFFHPTRKWRFDWAWPDLKVALEIDGGAWSQGRHTRGKGFIEDQAKGNAAVILGWRVLHCTPQDVETGAVFGLLKEVLG